MRVLIGRNPCLDQAIQTRKTIVLLLFYKMLELRKAGKITRFRLVISFAFLNSRNIPACLDQAIQTRKP
jgi:hypothetical protein